MLKSKLVNTFVLILNFSFEEDAEMKCKSYIEKAIEIDKDSPEGYQLMASFMLSKDDKEV